MRLKKLLFADIYRDGGSYEACFECDHEPELTISLLRSRSPDSSGLHHRMLYVYPGRSMPSNVLPIPTHSEAERHLVSTLSRFLESGESVAWSVGSDSDYYRMRAKELVNHIQRREPVFEVDVQALRQRHERLRDDVLSGRKSAEHFTFADPVDPMTIEA